MIKLGYKLSSEEHGPTELVGFAGRAEEAGFSFAAVSDHFHPWIDRQGHSPFVWAVLGGVAQVTERLEILTGVTCPTIRIHPAIVAQAAATAAVMLPGRFTLGVGSGENLNEHVVGARWPELDVRLEMLEEAMEVLRKLWSGGLQSFHGRHYTVENARLFDLPDASVPIAVAASGAKSAALAGRLGDAFIGLAPEEDLLEKFAEAGGRGKPRYAEINVCYAEDDAEARKTAFEWWPVTGVKGQLMQDLPLPSHFEAAAEMIHEEDALETVVTGADPEEHLAEIRKFADAGYDRIWVHQIGPDQEGFFNFYEKQVLPKI
ncbi:MAG: TIGR03557 family F420-dependent LLM class oxidoreductase [Actinomycetota bacterium]|nr:TIGR03557 family F420-dependent LLM class oxidoreductase [Actinomycetota bacterium]